MTAEDRLSRMLQERDADLERLKEEIEIMRDDERWRWARHYDLPEEQSLPVPRLEMWLDELLSDEWNRMWIYRMVHRHLLGHCVGVPFGCTKQGGTHNFAETLRDMMPFRDGAHIKHDAKEFGLPAFIIAGDKCEKIYPPETETSEEA